MSGDYFIIINGEQVPVSKEVYFAFKRPAWVERKRRQVRADKERSLDVILEHEQDVPETAALVEDIVEDRMMLDVLLGALSRLSSEEQAMVQALFFEGKTEKEVALQKGVSQQAIHQTKGRVLSKIRKFMDS